jgi:hypothetical protein
MKKPRSAAGGAFSPTYSQCRGVFCDEKSRSREKPREVLGRPLKSPSREIELYRGNRCESCDVRQLVRISHHSLIINVADDS